MLGASHPLHAKRLGNVRAYQERANTPNTGPIKHARSLSISWLVILHGTGGPRPSIRKESRRFDGLLYPYIAAACYICTYSRDENHSFSSPLVKLDVTSLVVSLAESDWSDPSPAISSPGSSLIALEKHLPPRDVGSWLISIDVASPQLAMRLVGLYGWLMWLAASLHGLFPIPRSPSPQSGGIISVTLPMRLK